MNNSHFTSAISQCVKSKEENYKYYIDNDKFIIDILRSYDMEVSLSQMVEHRTSEKEFWGSIPESLSIDIFISTVTKTGGTDSTLR